jgi:hypothetical protein
MLELYIIKLLLKINNYNKYCHHIKLKEEDKELKEHSYLELKEIL